jgi:TonB-linked SusC/RagA family outer membrane protein
MVRPMLALVMALAVQATAHAQAPGRIAGTVLDSASGSPVSAVRISVLGTRLGALSDDEGRYVIAGIPAGTYALEARRVGYRPQTVPRVTVAAGATSTVDLRVTAAALSLEAVVTTGVVDPTAGRRIPFTVGRLDIENAPVPATSVGEGLAGKIAGVTVVTPGQPGSGSNILLRSPVSINKTTSPLIVVDGVILSQSFGGSSADLESTDIESIEIVKGAAAASLYGSRAASGVIQIRTRRGSTLPAGATQVIARSEIGNNSLGGKIDWARHHYYLTDASGRYVDAAGSVVQRAQRVAKPIYQRFQDVPYHDPVYDQVDRFFDPGQFFKNSITLQQNTGRTNWLLSVVNSREDGVVLNSGRFEQNDIRVNLDHRPRESIRLSFSGYHSRSNRFELYGDTFFDLINQAPDVDLRVPDPDGTPFLFQGDPEGREENPLYVLATEDSKRKRARTQGSLEGRWSPFGWLTFDSNVSYDRSDRRTSFFLDAGKRTEGFGQGGLGEIEQTSGTTDAINAAASANLLGRVSRLTLRSSLRALIERETNQLTEARGEILSTPGVRSLQNAQQRFVSDTLEEIRTNSYIVTGGADYDGRYIVDGLVRSDGSSLFGPDERWNTYYRMSGAYRIAEESWWPFPAINEFKLRASRGTAGGRPSFSDQFETFEFLEGGGLQKVTLGNRALKPEHATETEVGIDAILRDRYSLQLTYAKNRVVDQLVLVPLAGFFGYSSRWLNAGTVEGNTIEATLEANVVQRPNLTWRVGLVTDRSRHKITEFDRSCFQTNTIAFRCAGASLSDMYGFRFVSSTSELPAAAREQASQFAVNDEGLLVFVGLDSAGVPYRYTDGESKRRWGTNTTIGSGVYQWGMPIMLRDSTGSASVVKIGSGQPDLHFGVSNIVSWRDFQFFALVDANVGCQVYNQTNQRMYQWARSADVDQTGKPQELKKPIDYYVALYQANDPVSYFVEDASFVKLREVAVRYRLSPRFLAPFSRVGARAISLGLIGRNLLTFTGYKGYDPEVGGTITRLDSFDYPRYRTITGTIQIEF